MSRPPARILTTALGVAGAAVAAVGIRDYVQPHHSILRTFPVLGRARFLLEHIRPEIQQYFIESNTDGKPFDRDTRSMIYQQAKDIGAEDSFGTERDLLRPGHDSLLHSARPVPPLSQPPRVRLGGKDCTQPYDISLFNISSMSFGALSANAVMAMGRGAAAGGFSQETGEGGLTRYHLESGADLIWEFGSGYFGCRTDDGHFCPDTFATKAALPQVKAILIKLSQGAKPGIGGMLPGEKVTPEIAEARQVPVGVDCLSPSAHSAFTTPVELMEFIATLRQLSGGKPIGFKLCVGTRVDVLSLCKAMLRTGITPDFITIDGSEGGTGAAPLEFLDRVGTPLSEGLMTMHNALVGCGLREEIALGAAGKVVGGADIIRRIALGADFTNSARSMMMATGCIQAQKCNTNACPTGVATQNPRLARGVDIPTKAVRVANYQRNTVRSALKVLGAMGLDDVAQLAPGHVIRRVDYTQAKSYEEIYTWLTPGSLCDASAPAEWMRDYSRADALSFAALPPRGAGERHQFRSV